MKYLALILLLLSCNSNPQPQKQQPAKTGTLPVPATGKIGTSAINTDDAFKTNPKDSTRFWATIDSLLKLPYVHAIDSAIKQVTNDKHGASFIVHSNFGDDTTYYHITVGDNHNEDRYVTLCNFVLNKQTGEIKVFDTATDSLLTLKDWQKQHP